MHYRAWCTTWVAATVFFLVQVTGCRAQPLQCDPPSIEVSASDSELAAQVCKIAAKADAGFGELGLTHARKIVIHISEKRDVALGHWVAHTDLDKGIIEIPSAHSLDGSSGSLGPFPMLSAPALFESLIVHELAHAYIDQTAGGRSISRLAHEYLAYALQLDQLPETDRDLILQQAEVSEPVGLGDFHEAMLSFSPLRYAAMAWLHFTRQGDPAAFAQRIIEGDVVFQSLRE